MIHPCIRSGWFNSIAGVVKRRFASYVKLNLTSGDKQQDKDPNGGATPDKRSSPNPTHYGTSASQLPVSSMIYPPSPHMLSNDRRQHRSPDPPPRLLKFIFESLFERFLNYFFVPELVRYNRGQSPLVLRRNLLEYGQAASGSPIPARR